MVDNKYTAEVIINLNGKDYKLCYDWAAIGAMQTAFGDRIVDNVSVTSKPEDISKMLAIGLNKNHPEITAADVFKMSPPIFHAVKKIDLALRYTYFGSEDFTPEKESAASGKKSIKKKIMFWKR